MLECGRISDESKYKCRGGFMQIKGIKPKSKQENEKEEIVEIQQEVIRDRSIDFVKYIDEINNNTFSVILDNLYQVLNYKVLKISDIRRIDLAEKIVSTISVGQAGAGVDANQGMAYFASSLKLYLNTYIKCVEGSRAAKYFERLNELLDQVVKYDYDENDIQDILTVFISLFRVCKKGELEKGKEHFVINDLTVSLSPDDLAILDWIKDNGEFEPGMLARKKYMKGTASSFVNVYSEKKCMYITAVILVCYYLEKCGYYEE